MLIFLVEAVLISLSGVLAPGPVTAVVVGKGSQSPHAGALVAVGHGIVEIPLMVAVFYGIGQFLNRPTVKIGVGVLGGLLLALMALDMLRGAREARVDAQVDKGSPVLAGVLLSLGNPYFLIWWVTVGAALILRSVEFGLLGFVMFAALHWLCDFVWSYFLSALTFKGGAFFGQRFQQIVFVICGLFLLFSGGRLMLEATQAL